MAPQLEQLGFHPGVHYIAVNVSAGAAGDVDAAAAALEAVLQRWLRAVDVATDVALASIAAAGRAQVLSHRTHAHQLSSTLKVLAAMDIASERRARRATADSAREAAGTCSSNHACTAPPRQRKGVVPGVDLIRDAHVVLLRPSGNVVLEPLLPLMEAWVANVRAGLPRVPVLTIRASQLFKVGGEEDAATALQQLGLRSACCATHPHHTQTCCNARGLSVDSLHVHAALPSRS